MATAPPTRLLLRDLDGQEVEVILGDGLLLRRGLVRIDLPQDAGRDLLRWLFWHSLHGRFAPRLPPMRQHGAAPPG